MKIENKREMTKHVYINKSNSLASAYMNRNLKKKIGK